MNISGAIFDLDGTLLDTTELWEGVAARYITSLRKTPEQMCIRDSTYPGIDPAGFTRSDL